MFDRCFANRFHRLAQQFLPLQIGGLLVAPAYQQQASGGQTFRLVQPAHLALAAVKVAGLDETGELVAGALRQ